MAEAPADTAMGESGAARRVEDLSNGLLTSSDGHTLVMTEDDVAMGSVWTPGEDRALRAAVETFGELEWELVAAEVEGRNHEQCHQRWNEVLKPALAKWSYEEDKILEEIVLQGGHSWEGISARLLGRTYDLLRCLPTGMERAQAKECRSRWRNYLDPSTSKAYAFKHEFLPFTQEEDATIEQAYERFGNNWNEIAELLPRRTEESVKARWSVLSRNWSRKANTKRTLMPDAPGNSGGATVDQNRSVQQPHGLLGAHCAQIAELIPAGAEGAVKISAEVLGSEQDVESKVPSHSDAAMILVDLPPEIAMPMDGVKGSATATGGTLSQVQASVSDIVTSRSEIPSDAQKLNTAEVDGKKLSSWTPEQDEALRAAVEKYGQRNWKSIAAEVEGRNHAQCLQRWNKVLKPGLVKAPWSDEEDRILERMALEGCHTWGEISTNIPGRTAKECRERGRNHLDLNINKAPFTPEEDSTIQQAYEQLGSRWARISELLPGRTEDAVKMRWKALNPNQRTNAKPGRPRLVHGNDPRESVREEVAKPSVEPIGVKEEDNLRDANVVTDPLSPSQSSSISLPNESVDGMLASGELDEMLKAVALANAESEASARDSYEKALASISSTADKHIFQELIDAVSAAGDVINDFDLMQNDDLLHSLEFDSIVAPTGVDDLISVSLDDEDDEFDEDDLLKPIILPTRHGDNTTSSGDLGESKEGRPLADKDASVETYPSATQANDNSDYLLDPTPTAPNTNVDGLPADAQSGFDLSDQPSAVDDSIGDKDNFDEEEIALMFDLAKKKKKKKPIQPHEANEDDAENREAHKGVSLEDGDASVETNPSTTQANDNLDYLLDLPYNGFLSAPAEDTYGSSNLWIDPELLGLRLDATEVTIPHTQNNTTQWDNKNTTKVYAATYRGESVAVKRLTEVGRTLENAAALATLCKTLHDLTHPNIIPIIGLSWSKALDIQVITPLATRGDLRSLLDSSDAASLTWEDFKCQVSIDVVSARACLHRQNFSAGLGGLASWNVLLDGPDGTAKLNLVRLECRGLSDAHVRVPSPLRWVAPEVVLGGPQSSSADMYALGVLLTELDTTQLPFHDAVSPNGTAMDDMLIAMRVAKGDLRPTLSPTCPDVIAELVDKCLSAEPTQRPRADQAMYQLRAMLKEL